MLRNDEIYVKLKINRHTNGPVDISYYCPSGSQFTKFCVAASISYKAFEDLLKAFRSDYIKKNNPGCFDFFIFTGCKIKVKYEIEDIRDNKIVETKKGLVDPYEFLRLMQGQQSEVYKLLQENNLLTRQSTYHSN